MSVHVADGAARLSDKLPIVVRPWVVPVLSVAFLLSAGLGMVVTGPRRPAPPDANTRPRIWHLKTRIPAGSYRLLARALDQAGNVGLALRPVSVAVEPAAAFTIRNPYAVPGGFVKAQLHDHTANSFDGDKRFSPDVKAWYWKNAGFGVVVYTD